MPQPGDSRWRVFVESVAVAGVAFLVAGAAETALIGLLQPSEAELTWISDVLLASALGVAVYLWRHLQASRKHLAERERADLVLQTQLSIAADIQRRLLPALPSHDSGIEWAAALRSAGRIGGDFYDIVESSPGCWLLLVADVSGKGIPAAMALGSLRAAFRSVARDYDQPARVVASLSAVLHAEWLGAPYITCVAARIDVHAWTLTCANAGHPAAIIFSQGAPTFVRSSGPPAGLLPNADYVEETVALLPGDRCVAVTDGVTEALDDDIEAIARRISSMPAGPAASAQDVCDLVMQAAVGGSGPSDVPGWDDDRTVVVVARRPRSQS